MLNERVQVYHRLVELVAVHYPEAGKEHLETLTLPLLRYESVLEWTLKLGCKRKLTKAGGCFLALGWCCVKVSVWSLQHDVMKALGTHSRWCIFILA